MQEVVATGIWLYDGVAPTAVRVIMLDYDFWYEIGAADDNPDPDEVPELNNSGHLYYVLHGAQWQVGEQFWPDSQGFRTQAEAVAAAQSVIPVRVVWRVANVTVCG